MGLCLARILSCLNHLKTFQLNNRKNTIPEQAIQVVKTEKEDFWSGRRDWRNFSGSAVKHEENISVSEGAIQSAVNNEVILRSIQKVVWVHEDLLIQLLGNFNQSMCFLQSSMIIQPLHINLNLHILPRRKRIYYLEKFISQIQEYMQQSDMTLTCWVSTKQ